jgi:hypothetical protein
MKSINVNVLFSDDTVLIQDHNLNVDLSIYVYNNMLVLRGIINEHNSLHTNMFIKQNKDALGDYIVTFEPERIKVHMRFKISGNPHYDCALPIIAVAKLVELVNSKTLLNLLPPSLK